MLQPRHEKERAFGEEGKGVCGEWGDGGCKVEGVKHEHQHCHCKKQASINSFAYMINL